MSAQAPIYNGKHDGYYWIEIHDLGLTIHDIVDNCADVIDGKYVAIAALRRRPLIPTSAEFSLGWTAKHDVAISPRVDDTVWVPSNDYTEWYVFTEPPDPDRFAATAIFAHYLPLSFRDARAAGYDNNVDPEVFDELQQRLWAQIERLDPESYLAESTWLLFATKNYELYLQVEQWMHEEQRSE